MYRLLKPDGRVAISDILLKQDLPNELKSNMALYVGCVAGARRVEEYEKYLRKAGFKGSMYWLDCTGLPLLNPKLIWVMIADILIVADQNDLNVYKTANKDGMKNSTEAGCCGPGSEEKSPCYSGVVGEDGKWRDIDFNEWAGEHSFVKKCGASEAYIASGSFKIYAIKPDVLNCS